MMGKFANNKPNHINYDEFLFALRDGAMEAEGSITQHGSSAMLGELVEEKFQQENFRCQNGENRCKNMFFRVNFIPNSIFSSFEILNSKISF